MPGTIGQLKALKNLDLENSAISSLLEEVGGLASLEELNLSYTKELTALPATIGQLKCLKTLNLEECEKLRLLPDSKSRHLESFYFLIFDA